MTSGGRDSSVVERRTHGRKVSDSSTARAGGWGVGGGGGGVGGGAFSLYFGIRDATVTRNRSGHSAESAGGRLQLNTHAASNSDPVNW